MIIHFWDLPEKRNYVLLKEEFKNQLIKILEEKRYSWKIRDRIKHRKISIKKIKKISKEEKIGLKIFETKIIWIGGNNSKGISNPRLPFKFSTRSGARFISAIVNDGCLTKGKNNYGRIMYDNFDETIRNSITKDYLDIFGGNKNEIAFRNYKHKKFFEFTSVVRDIVELILREKGPKADNNIKIPEFIFKNKDTMVGWIEQTIADEGEIKYYPKRYRRAIVWRRSIDVPLLFNKKIYLKEISIRKLSKKTQKLVENQKCNIIEKEKEILDSLGIKYNLYNVGIYKTEKNKIRTRWQINIAGRENLMKLRKIIIIPSKEKDIKFCKAVNNFVRYKEPLRIKDTVIKLGKNSKKFTSIDLKNKMNYKNLNASYKWLKKFENEGLIKKVKESNFRINNYKKPTEYQLIPHK